MTTYLCASHRQKKGFTLVELLVVIAIIGILVALLLPAIQAAREAARRAQCQSQLHNLAIAVLNYESSNKVLPNGMTFDPALSGSVQTLSQYGPNWVIDILSYMEEQPLYDSFDFTKQINDAANSKNFIARGTAIPALLCPSDPFNKVPYQGKTGSPHGGNWGRTNYAASAGRAFIYGSGTDPPSMNGGTGPLDNLGWKDNCGRGVMGPNVAVKMKRISDGTSKTIMLGEIRAGLTEQDARGVWAMGHAGASLLAKYGSGGDANGPNLCDPLGDDVYSDVCAPAGGVNPTSQAECMGCYGGTGFDQATTRSSHTGGVFMAMCDGSVQFISNDIETGGGLGGNCCAVWDWMILSGDGGRGGILQLDIKKGYCK